MTNYIRERGGRGGGRHRTESTSTTMDTHLTHTHARAHTHTHYNTGSQSAFHCTLLAAGTSLCLVKKKKTIFFLKKQWRNWLTNKQTKRRTTRILDPTGKNKKINQKRNLGYKKSQWHQFLRKAFSRWLAFEQLYAFSFSLPSIYY